MIVTVAFPATQANQSLWHSNAALVPMAALVARLRRPLLALAVVVSGAIAVPLERYSVDGHLI
jgi:hypothetical protein